MSAPRVSITTTPTAATAERALEIADARLEQLVSDVSEWRLESADFSRRHQRGITTVSGPVVYVRIWLRPKLKKAEA